MIRNHRFAPEYRIFALHSAEKSLAKSRCVLRCKKRRMRHPLILQTLPDTLKALKTHSRQSSTDEDQNRTLVPDHDAIRIYWEEKYMSPSFYTKHETSVEQKTIADLEPDFAHIPLQDLIWGIRVSPGEYKPWGCVGELQAEPPQSVLPKEIEIVTDDYGLSTCPTHYFAVYASVASGHKWPRRIQIYPAQAFIVALFCSRLRFPPPEKPHVTPVGLEEVPEVADSSDTMTITTSALRLPVVHVCIPEPAVFPILFNYFHNTNMREFSLNLIGEWVPRSPDMSLQAYRMHFAAAIAKHHSPVKIWSYMVNVRATWRNMMALGVSDEELWAMIYHLWFVAWKAREIQTLKPGRYVGPKDASTGADSEKV